MCEKSYRDIGREELGGKKPGMYFAGGGLVCNRCGLNKKPVQEIAECGLREISNMQLLLKGDWRLISGSELTLNEQKSLHKLVFDYTVYHSEKRFVDWGKLSQFS